LRINRKWMPLLSADFPLNLWSRILAKAHATLETSHGPEGLSFLF
jgi:hypothetical protein